MVTNLPALCKSARFRQTILSLCVSISFFCIGLTRAYSSSAVPSMQELNPGLLPSKNIASWASSIAPLGAFFGSLMAGPLMHYTGRKFPVIITSPIWALAWSLIALATNWESVMVGRLLSGICAGLCLPSAQIYVTESTDPKTRGVIGSFPSLAMSLGILVSYVIGSFSPWHILAWSSSFFAIILTFVMCFLPESPVWLQSKNHFVEANESREWLGLVKYEDLVKDFEVQKSEEAEQIEKIKTNSADAHSMKVLLTRPILLPFGIGLTLLCIQQLSGIDAIVFFTVDIFKASGSSMNHHVATIIVGAVQLISNILSLFVVDKAGRKPLLIASGIIMCLSMASMGTAFYLNSIGNTSFGYLPLASLIIFMVGFSIGFGCIPFLLMGELFPSPQRSLLSSLAGSFNLGVMFIVIKTYHPLEHLITTAGTFWMYSILCFLGIIFVCGFVPETKGRELDSIAKLFIKKSKSDPKVTISRL